MNETNQLRSELERMTLVYQLFEKEKSDHEATKQQLDAANRREQRLRETILACLRCLQFNAPPANPQKNAEWFDAIRYALAALQPDAGHKGDTWKLK